MKTTARSIRFKRLYILAWNVKARTIQILTKIGLMTPDVMPAIIMKIE